MNRYIEIIKNAYSGYWNYLKNSVLFEVQLENYFYGLIIISLFIWLLELRFPWRKNQPVFRKDFWLDTFYMFFNFFLLNLIVLTALSNVTEQLLNDTLGIVNLSVASFQLFDVNSFPYILKLLVFFIQV